MFYCPQKDLTFHSETEWLCCFNESKLSENIFVWSVQPSWVHLIVPSGFELFLFNFMLSCLSYNFVYMLNVGLIHKPIYTSLLCDLFAFFI